MDVASGYNPYYTFARYIKKNFDTKAFRISVDGFFGCPGKCIYCENSFYTPPADDLVSQIRRQREHYTRRFKAEAFYLYFQKGTGTAAPVETLRRIYDRGLGTGDFLGLIVGTRPDHADKAKVELFREYSEDMDVWIEYGLQSSYDSTLKTIKRGHTYDDFVKAVELTAKAGVKSTVHLILGLPGETPDMMVRTVRRLSALGVSGVKFHHLYVLKGTELHRWYLSGDYRPMGYGEYVDIITECLRNLRKDIVVHRILGENRTDRHVAPDWDGDKISVIRAVKDHMRVNGYRQGDLFGD